MTPLASRGASECLSNSVIVLTRSNLFLETSLQWQTALQQYETAKLHNTKLYSRVRVTKHCK